MLAESSQEERRVRATLEVATRTDVGLARDSNQDTYAVSLAPQSPGDMDGIFVVADGMGGHAGGELASQIAVTELLRYLRSNTGDADIVPDGTASWLRAAVQHAGGEVRRASSSTDTRGMGTTLVAALVRGRDVTVANVGDSRAYLLRRGKLEQVTRDHSFVADEVARGNLTPDQAASHPKRNVLTRALGPAPDAEADTFTLELRKGDTLLLCSDGLHGQVGVQDIAQMLKSAPPEDAARRLIDMANASGGSDNVTVVLARVAELKKGRAPGRRSSETTSSVDGAGRSPLMTLALLPFLPLRLAWRIIRWVT